MIQTDHWGKNKVTVELEKKRGKTQLMDFKTEYKFKSIK